MNTEQTIPLNMLVPSKANVRRTGKAEGIGELAASIEAHGLRQNLNVQPSDDGQMFEVVAGGRRLRAMKLLAKSGKLAEDFPVSCLVLGEGESGTEISLTENAMREAMHPDDQFEAFRTLIEKQGATLEDIAARFGVTPAVVKQRLKLANVSSKLRALFRKGEMTLAHVMAFAVSDDHAAQEAVWESAKGWQREPDSIRDALTEASIASTDRLARFVGIEGYIAAGGAVTSDLFAEQETSYLDRGLVMQLAEAKLEQEAEALRAEGWKWVRWEFERDYSVSYGHLRGKLSAKGRARAGVLLRIGQDGQVEAERGLIDPADVKAEEKARKAAERVASGEAEVPSGGMSSAVIADLCAHRTAALRIELARRPDVALAMMVQALASKLRYDGGFSCLDIGAKSLDLARQVRVVTDSPAHEAMEAEGARWSEKLPEDPANLPEWCLSQPQPVLMDLLAYLTALTVNAMGDRSDTAALAKAVGLDMVKHWTPSVDGFFGRLPKAALRDAVTEAKVKVVDFAGAKKLEAATLAEAVLKGSGWLPKPLRFPV